MKPGSKNSRHLNLRSYTGSLPIKGFDFSRPSSPTPTTAQPRRKPWAQPSTRDPIEWIETYFYIPETRDPVQLADYQKDCIREALRVGPDGLFVYSTIVWADIKKSIKSTIAAAMCLWWADTVEWSSLKVVANDLKQADSREGFYMRRAIELNSAYFNDRGVRIKPSGYTIDFAATHSRIESIPQDPKGEAGGNDDLIVFTELWAAKGNNAERMWTEMTLSPTKFGKSLRWVETYAGFTGESAILEGLYQAGVKEGAALWQDRYGEMAYANSAARVFCLWNTVPRLSWQTTDYYAQEEAMLLPGEFARVHRNQWASSAETFVPYEWWQACRGALPPLDPYEPQVLALDAGVSSDCFAAVSTSRDPQNSENVAVRGVEEWRPPKGGKIVFSRDDDDTNYQTSTTPYAYVLRQADAGNIVEVAYDPYQLHDLATRLRYQGIPVREFGQGAERLEADKRLRDLIRDRRITHLDDPRLNEAIKNANAKAENERLRLVKKAEHLKIDAAVALSMSADRCLRLNLG